MSSGSEGELMTAKFVAHRGNPARFPDNSLAGILSAIEAGAKFVEMDVQLTSDLEPVLFHDRDLQRICGTGGSVHQFSLQELGKLDAAEATRFGTQFSGTRIPTLAELCQLLRQQPDVHVFVELKRVSIEQFGVDAVWHAVEQHLRPISRQVVVISFNDEILVLAREAGWPVGMVLEEWRERDSANIKQLDPAFIFLDVDKLPASGALSVEAAEIVVYDVVDPGLAKALIGRGAGLVETFDICGMLAALQRQ